MIGITAAVVLSLFWGYQFGKNSRDQRIRDADNLIHLLELMTAHLKKAGGNVDFIERAIADYKRKHHGKN